MIRTLKLLGAMLFAAALVACGGGGGSPGTTPGGGGGGGGGTPSAVADFAMFFDKTTIANNGTDSAGLTVQAVDASRNVVSGATVQVRVDQGAVFVPSGTTTDAAGRFTGTVNIGGDKRDRDVTVTVTINGITKQTTVRIAGSRVTLQAAPSAPSPGQSVLLTAALVDSAGAPIPNVDLTLGGTIPALQGRTIRTSSTGQATTTFAAPTTAGIYVITAAGSGVVSPDYQIQVFSSSIPAAVIPAGVAPSLAASPNVLSVNNPGSTANKSTLRFLMLDANNQPIQNVRVRFEDVTTGLAAVGASISSGTTTLYTDAGGSVSTQYIAGQNSSPTNGVTVRACYSATDFVSATDCPASVTATLTVAGQALAVSVGDDNTLSTGGGGGTYIKRFVVTVADSAGRAVPNANVDISVDLTHYGKGDPFNFGYRVHTVPLDLNSGSAPLDYDPNLANDERVWCPNEDRNRNGNVDPLENINNSTDSNGQPTLEPRKSDLLISYDSPAVTTTDASGILIIKVEYSQRFGTWLAYKLRVTANVAGSQGMAERLFVTDVLEDDVENGSFLNPPYGIRSCMDSD